MSYVIHEDTVPFRTSPYSSLGQHMHATQAAFEVDDIDHETDAGLSVLVRGPATYVEGKDLLEAVPPTNAEA